MRRVRYHAHGGPEVLVVKEADIDVQLRRETSPDSIWFRSLPGTLTGDVVGAEYVVADAGWLARVPAQLSVGAASMLPTVP